MSTPEFGQVTLWPIQSPRSNSGERLPNPLQGQDQHPSSNTTSRRASTQPIMLRSYRVPGMGESFVKLKASNLPVDFCKHRVLLPSCASSSPRFHLMMCTRYVEVQKTLECIRARAPPRTQVITPLAEDPLKQGLCLCCGTALGQK